MSVKNRALGGLLAGRISIITGASSGLGRATALAFARQGATVVCADLASSQKSSSQTISELIREQGGTSMFVPTDVSEEQSVQDLTRAAVEAYGRIDMCVAVTLFGTCKQD
jgi:NAD(P)-dependent dehydrogenase (short-subunit alcohol dehydrogenase family)